jgi:hypothetical protein
VDGPVLAKDIMTLMQVGRVQLCVRPVRADELQAELILGDKIEKHSHLTVFVTERILPFFIDRVRLSADFASASSALNG